jgi:hypothetical protein
VPDSESYRVNWRSRVRPGSAEAYSFAIVCVVIASLARWGLGQLSEGILVFPTYYPAVLFAALIGGAGAGIFAAILGGIVGWWAFMPPRFTFSLTIAQQIGLLTYLLASLLIVWGADHYRRLTQRLEDEEKLRKDEEKFRKLAVDELAHRLKNKLATIQSIISFQLRDEPQIRDAILSRLTALSATDDLIMATQGQGARLRDILSAELRPYEVSRVSMTGADILLPSKLALMMALLVHELATNANTVRWRVRWVSYQSAGRLRVDGWNLNGAKVVDQQSLLRPIAVLERDYFRVPLSSLVGPSRQLLQRRGLFAN